MTSLKVRLSITRNDEDELKEPAKDPRLIKSFANLDFDVSDDDLDLFHMQVESAGKFSRKANWEDLKRFTGKEINSDVFRDMVVNYQVTCFPEDAAKPNHTPKKCYIKDENGGTIFRDFGWKPVKLNLQTGMVDIKERWTKEVCLESFPLDYSTNLERILLEQGDKKVTSTLRKSKLAGHPLALEMMKTSSEILIEFKGIDSVTFVLGNKEPSETDEENGDEVWRDVKSLRALLHDAKLPTKSGAGVTREAKVLANESYLKARIYYKAFFSNDVATDHHEKFDGKQYWKFPIKYLFQYNDIPNAAIVYEDVELRFFTDVRVAMDNKDWEWVKDENGRWKKQFGAITTSISRRKSDSVTTQMLKPIEVTANEAATGGKKEEKKAQSESVNTTSDAREETLAATPVPALVPIPSPIPAPVGPSVENPVEEGIQCRMEDVAEQRIAYNSQIIDDNRSSENDEYEMIEGVEYASTTKGDGGIRLRDIGNRAIDESTTGDGNECLELVDAESPELVNAETLPVGVDDIDEPVIQEGAINASAEAEAGAPRDVPDNTTIFLPRQSRPDPDGLHLNDVTPNQTVLLQKGSQCVEVL